MEVKPLRPKDLRAFHKKVRTVVLALVNDNNLRWRMPDGQHLFIYPPDGTSRPFKVSAHRRDDATLNFLREQFCKPYDLEMP